VPSALQKAALGLEQAGRAGYLVDVAKINDALKNEFNRLEKIAGKEKLTAGDDLSQ